MTAATRERIRRLRAHHDAKIQAAYWEFSRGARARPPVMVVPDSYRVRARCEELLGIVSKPWRAEWDRYSAALVGRLVADGATFDRPSIYASLLPCVGGPMLCALADLAIVAGLLTADMLKG